MKNNTYKKIDGNLKFRYSTGIFVFLLMVAFSCISPFDGNFREESNYLVVDGSIIKGQTIQTVKLSKSSQIEHSIYLNPKFVPFTNCIVRVIDDKGDEFLFQEGNPGYYNLQIEDSQLEYGTGYKLLITTPSGNNYESTYQTIVRNDPVDNLYCNVENHYESGSDLVTKEGYQFYVDLKTSESASKYYRWQIRETYEVRASLKINGVYDGVSVKVSSIQSDSLYYCFKTKIANGVYTTTTKNLLVNEIKQIPLHFLLKESAMLGFKYCATVHQYPLSKDAYDYWHQREIELSQAGEIYATQPSQVGSNITNLNNPEEKALGFFWASSDSYKRLFLSGGVNYDEGKECNYVETHSDLVGPELERFLLNFIKNVKNLPKPPIYIIKYLDGYYFAKTNDCLDCRLIPGYGYGTTKRPDFWE